MPVVLFERSPNMGRTSDHKASNDSCKLTVVHELYKFHVHELQLLEFSTAINAQDQGSPDVRLESELQRVQQVPKQQS